MSASAGKPTIGMVGLGIMGRPMVRNLMKAGYKVTGHNRSRGPVDELAAEGMTAARSAREGAERVDVGITMLPDSPDVEAGVGGAEGGVPGGRWGATVVGRRSISR